MTATQRFAVFGHPIAHSLSPRLHVWFARAAGIAIDYAAIDAAPVDFTAVVQAFFAAGGRGANVTLPHKAAACALADVRSPVAARLGVANVLTPLSDGGLEADSNDGAGMLADLRTRCGVDPRGRNVLLLGAGGAARAAAFALQDAGVAALTLANRTLARAQALAAALGAEANVHAIEWSALPKAGAFDLVINATSAGVQHAAPALPAALAQPRTFAYDLSYGPVAAWFIAWARAARCAGASDGLGMLVETAAASFERWHGVRPDTGTALGILSRDTRP